MTAHVFEGDPASSVIVHVPHASYAIPQWVREGIMLDDLALGRELRAMTDAHTDCIAVDAAPLPAVRPWVFVNGLSRLVVDPERFPDEREEMNAVGMGAVYERTSDGFVLRDLSAEEVSGLVDRFFVPCAESFTALVEQRLAAAGRVTILDLHSFPREPNPYELHGGGPRPEVCIGTDAFHTPDDLADAAQAAFAAAAPNGDIGLDSPFSGCYVPLAHYEQRREVRAVMLELRRDVVDDDYRPLVSALASLVDRVEDGGR